MRTLKLAVSATLVLAAIALTPTTAHGYECDEFSGIGIDCSFTAFSQNPQGDPALPVTCDPTDGVACWVNDCKTYIADDSARWGTAWDNNPTTAPVSTALLPFINDADADNYASAHVGAGGTVGWYSETGQWWTCTQVDAEIPAIDQLLNPGPNGTTYGPVGPIINVTALRDAARTQAHPGPPDIQKSTGDGVASIVQAPTWFWIEPTWWTTTTGTQPSTTGRMTVTVTATPTDTIWETGEGQLTDCEQGKVYQPGISDPDDRFGCIWIYQHSSGWVGHLYRAEATVRTELNWNMTFNNGTTFDQGQLPDLYTTNGFDIETHELLAIATYGN